MIPGTVCHVLYLGGKALIEREIGLRLADSHTGNHPEDDFTPLETIRRSHGTIGKRIPFELEGEAFKPERRVRHQAPQSNVMYASMNALLSTSRIKTKSWATIEDSYRRTVCIEFAKDSIAIYTCELFEEEFNDFLALYPIPPAYQVILPKSNQTVFDAPPGYVHISRLNHFGCTKLTTFVVMCKAYGCEPTVELFRGFFNLCRAGKWLTFAKRPEKHIPHLFPKVITRIDDKLPPNIEQNPMFQRLGRYPISVRVFPDPILFLAGLQSSWEHGQNFVYAEDEEDLSFLPQEPSLGFGTGSASASVKIEPLRADEELVLQPAEVTADSGGSPKPELFVVHPGSVAARIKDRKCNTREGSSRPPGKRKLASVSSNSHATRAKTYTSKDDVPFLTVFDDDEGLFDVPELKDATACYLKIYAISPPAWKNHLDNHMDVELLDLHDRCYARQAVVDNAVNRRSRELLEVIEKLRGECDVIKERERAREEESESLRVKCEAAMSDLEKNPTVIALREKIYDLSNEIASLEIKKARLKAANVSLRKEVDDVKRDRMEVVSKVVPYAAMELIHNDDLEPFDLSKVKGYRPSYKKEHDQASNDLATATFPRFSEFVADPSAPVEVLLSKKPPSLQRPAPSKTQALVSSSQKATSSSVLASNLMSSPIDASVVKP
ncbi:hypothetical protein Tco_0521032 [Tanacetum coccineum]